MANYNRNGLHIGKKNILVVDDEPGVVSLIGDYLTIRGYNIYAAFDGKEGFDVARKIMPDMIILDIMMPRANGYEMLKRLKEDKKMVSTPVIMLSAKTGDADKLKAMELYSETYITKPFKLDDLREKIETVFKTSGIGL